MWPATFRTSANSKEYRKNRLETFSGGILDKYGKNSKIHGKIKEKSVKFDKLKKKLGKNPKNGEKIKKKKISSESLLKNPKTHLKSLKTSNSYEETH